MRSFERYCKDYENIENYDKALADNFKGWCCHHRLQTWNSDGERRPIDITVAELKALGMYYNRPASELIFLTSREHKSLHSKEKHYMLGKKFSEETRKKMSEARKGKYTGENNPMYGKHPSEETLKKMSEAQKGKKMSEEARKKMSEAKKNMSEETKNKIGAAKKGTRWYNDGKINIRAKECPYGFTPGRLLI